MKKYTMTIFNEYGEVMQIHHTNSLKQIERWWREYAYTGKDLNFAGFNSRYEVRENEMYFDNRGCDTAVE